MKLLAINTGFKQANIAFHDGQNVRYKTIDSNCKHAEIVLKNIDELLAETKIKDVEAMAIVVGPGSFTGVRIAVALAKGFMVANSNLKSISISSLDLMSFIYQKQKPTQNYTCVLNALSGNYFMAKYSKSGECLSNPKMVNGEELEQIKNEFVVGLKDENTEFANFDIMFTSEDLLEYALIKAQNKEFCQEKELVPVYLRLSQAEQNLKEKEKYDTKVW